MSRDDTYLFLKKLKLVTLCLLIAVFNLGGFIDFFGDCPPLDGSNAEDGADEPGLITLSYTIAPNKLTMDAGTTGEAVATASTGGDEPPAGDFFQWRAGAGDAMTAGVTNTLGLSTTLRFTAASEGFIKDNFTLLGFPVLGEGSLSLKTFAEAKVTQVAQGVNESGGGVVDITVNATADTPELTFFPAVGRVEVLFSPRTRLDFGGVPVGTPSGVRGVYMVNRSASLDSVRIDGAIIAGGDDSQFTETVPISDTQLTSFDSVTFPIQFFPNSVGTKTSTLIIDYTVFDRGVFGTTETPVRVNIQVRGTGVAMAEE